MLLLGRMDDIQFEIFINQLLIENTNRLSLCESFYCKHIIKTGKNKGNVCDRYCCGIHKKKLSDFKLVDKKEICSICLEDDGDRVSECGHFFHEKCVFEWISHKGNKFICPVCRHRDD